MERTPESLRQALLRLASDESLRTRLAKRARAAGERHFRPERFVSAYEDLPRGAGSRLYRVTVSTQSRLCTQRERVTTGSM